MSKLRNSAKGQACQIRLPGICSFNNEETILAHLNGGGMGMKKNDLFGAFSCAKCHDELDRRTQHLERNYVELAHRQGVERTQEIWLKLNLINIGK